MLRVFVSSTWQDLQAERAVVERVLAGLEAAKFLGMEYFGANPGNTTDESLSRVDRADLFLLILGLRAGSGIVEKEYLRSIERGIPCLVYIKQADLNGDSNPLIRTVRARHLCYPFTDLHDLATRVSADVHRECIRALAPNFQSVIRSPQAVFERVHLEHFTGRGWLIQLLDEFMGSNPRGYLTIEAPAGLGKTTIAAHLALTRGWPAHFVELERGAAGVGPGLLNLAAQLLLLSTNELRLKWSALIAGRTSILPGEFEQILRSCGAACHQRNLNPVVLLVDGLDEAGMAEHVNPFGLPVDLPDGVFFVLTQRPGPTLNSTAPRLIVRLEGHQNAEDLRAYLKLVTTWPAVQSALKRGRGGAWYSAQDFVDAVWQRSSGVWIYVHHVVSEILSGDRLPLDLEELPSGLWDYYARYWTSWRRRYESAWYSHHLPILAVLAAARAEFPRSLLAEIAGIEIGAQTATILDVDWRSFLFVEGSPGPSRTYRLYHSSLAQFFAGDIPDHDLDVAASAFIEEVRTSTLSAHGRISDYFLGHWGGLRDNLPNLSEMKRRDLHDRYGLYHLFHHLSVSERYDDILALLCVERNCQDGTYENVWWRARATDSTLDGYTSDVRVALSMALNRLKKPLPPNEFPGALGEALRVVLILTSIRSMTATVPHKMLKVLFHSGVWSFEQCVQHCNRLSSLERMIGLATMARLGTTEQRDEILTEVLSVANLLNDADLTKVYASTGATLNPDSSLHLRRRALKGLTGLSRGHLGAVFATLAPHLSESECLEAGEEVLSVYLEYAREGSTYNPLAFTGLPRALPALPAFTKTKAVSAFLASLDGVLPPLGVLWFPFRQWLPHLTPIEQRAALQRVENDAADPQSFAAFLVNVADRIHADLGIDVWQRVANEGQSAPHLDQLLELAWMLPAAHAGDAIDDLDWIHDDDARKVVRETLRLRASGCLNDDPGPLWWRSFNAWSEHCSSCTFLRNRVAELPTEARHKAIDVMLSRFGASPERYAALSSVVELMIDDPNPLPADLVVRMMSIPRELDDWLWGVSTCTVFSPAEEAASEARAFRQGLMNSADPEAPRHGVYPAFVLALLGRQMTVTQRRSVVRCLSQCRHLTPSEISSAVACLSEKLSPKQASILWTAAVDCLRIFADYDPEAIVSALPFCAWALPEKYAMEILQMLEHMDEDIRWQGLFWLARYASDGLAAQIQRSASNLSPGNYGLAMCPIVNRLGGSCALARPLLSEAAFLTEGGRALLMAALASAFDGENRLELLGEAWRLSGNLPPLERTVVLFDVWRALPAADRSDALRELIDAALDAEGYELDRAWLPFALLTQSEDDKRHAARTIATILSQRPRHAAYHWLTVLSPFLRESGPEFCKHLRESIEQVARWWP